MKACSVTGDVLLVRPGIVHSVRFAKQGADALFLNGLTFPFEAPLAVALKGGLEQLARRSFGGDPGATAELRARLAFRTNPLPPKIAEIVLKMQADPMRRVTQDELVRYLRHGANARVALLQGVDGTDVSPVQAVVGRCSMRRKAWPRRELVRTAAIDAGFADTAHLSRVFSSVFGLPPSVAIAGLEHGGAAGDSLRFAERRI